MPPSQGDRGRRLAAAPAAAPRPAVDAANHLMGRRRNVADAAPAPAPARRLADQSRSAG
jgi:hypothetical protein